MRKIAALAALTLLLIAAPAAEAAKPRAPRQARGSAPSTRATGPRRIEISIAQQRLQAIEGGRVVISTAVSTGTASHPTPRGRFSVLSKEQRHWSTKYGVWMPYAMRVVGGVYIHELPISRDGRRSGVAALGNPASHGCIRVGIGPAASVFNFARVGTPVIIR